VSLRDLTPDRALIFRILHRDSLPGLIDRGLRCRNSPESDPAFVTIGNPDLIERRRHRPVPVPPGGTLGDYVPFYFTPRTPMLLNLCTGHGGIVRRPNADIVIAVACLHDLQARALPFVFTDRHAYLATAAFFTDLEDLDALAWGAWQASDFRRDPDNPDRFERYQAEALVYRHLPLDALRGLVCFDDDTQVYVNGLLEARRAALKVAVRPGWYFP
jgi:hypothetical protein